MPTSLHFEYLAVQTVIQRRNVGAHRNPRRVGRGEGGQPRRAKTPPVSARASRAPAASNPALGLVMGVLGAARRLTQLAIQRPDVVQGCNGRHALAKIGRSLYYRAAWRGVVPSTSCGRPSVMQLSRNSLHYLPSASGLSRIECEFRDAAVVDLISGTIASLRSLRYGLSGGTSANRVRPSSSTYP